MEEPIQNKTIPEINKDVNKNRALQLDSMNKEGLNEVKNNNETAKQSYPGCIEAIRQAKGKKKSHDVSLEMLFSCLPESVVKQHNSYLQGWWNYCLFVNKDPLETNLSVFISYLEKKLDDSASRDELKSIASSVCLIASDKMTSQIFSLSFLFSDFAKYSSVNNTDGDKTPEFSCQNNSKISSSDIEVKKQDVSQTASVQNKNEITVKVPELIDISDDQLSDKSPLTLSNKSTGLLKDKLLQKAMGNSQLTSPLKARTPKPPPIFLRKRRMLKQENNIKAPITATNNDQQIPSIDVSKSNPKIQELTIENTPPIVPTKPRMTDAGHQSILSANNINPEIDSPTNNVAPSIDCSKSPVPMSKPSKLQTSSTETLIPVIESSTPSVHHNTQSLPLCQLNTSALECSSNALEQNIVATDADEQSGLLVNTVQEKQQQNDHQLPSANDYPTKTLTPAIKPATSVESPVNQNILLLPCQLEAPALECSSQELKENKVETSDSLQIKLSLSHTDQNKQQEHNQLPSAIDDTPSNGVDETLIPAVKSPTPSANLPVLYNTQPLPQCQLNTSALECSSKALEQDKIKTSGNFQNRSSLVTEAVQKQQQRQLSSSNDQVNDFPTKKLISAVKATPVKLPVIHNTSSLNTSALESSSEKLNQNKVETPNNLLNKLSSGNIVQKRQQQQQQQPSANNNQVIIKLSTKTLTPAIKYVPSEKLPVKSYTSQLNTSALKCPKQNLNQNTVETSDNAQKEILFLVNTVLHKLQKRQLQPANNNNNNNDNINKTVLVAKDALPLSRFVKSSVKPEQSKLQKVLPAIKSPSANVPTHNIPPIVPCQSRTLECSSGRVNQNKVEKIVIPPKKLLISKTVLISPQKPLANRKQGMNVNSNNVAPKILRIVSSSILSKPKVAIKKTGNPPLLTPCQTNTSASVSSSEVIKQNNVKTTANLQSKILSCNATQKNQLPQQARSCLMKKTPVQSVNTSQSSTKSETLMNLDKSNSKSASDLSDRSINSNMNKDNLEKSDINYASLLKKIVDPQTTIVQHQVEGNTIKMLVVMADGEQRLISFNIPNEECTVNDLLEQAGIQFDETTTVLLIEDPVLKINYIVECKAGTIVDSTQTGDVNDELSSYDNALVDKKYLQDNYDDNNMHAGSTVNIEGPKYIDGKLAVCGSCSSPSMDFNRCYRCKKKIQNNPKTISYICRLARKKAMMMSIDKFYESVLNNDRTKLHLHTALTCRTVRIGSYKCTPRDHIIINTSGLILSVPLLEDETKIVKVHIEYGDIVKVLIHPSKPVPILFFYTNTISGSKIRDILGMRDTKGPYYDPAGEDETHKTITLLPESLNEKSKIILKQLFLKNSSFEELTAEEPSVTLTRLITPPKDYLNDSSSKGEDTYSNEEPNQANNELTNNNNRQVTARVIIEEPKYINGKLAVCGNCGLTSMDFNRCYWCKTQIQDNPETKPYSGHPPLKRHVMLINDNYYKSLANNNDKITNFNNNISSHTICPTPDSTNSFLADSNNKRKHSQLEITANEENSNKISSSASLFDQSTKKIALEKSSTSVYF